MQLFSAFIITLSSEGLVEAPKKNICNTFQEHTFTKAINDTGYIATCLKSGEWDAMPRCHLIHCNPLDLDENTVTLIDLTDDYFSDNLTETDGYDDASHSGTTGYGVGTLYQVDCTEFGDDFDFGKNIVRAHLYCNKT